MLFPQEESGQNRTLRVNKVGFENGEITCSFKWIISIFAHKFVDGHNCMVKKNKNQKKKPSWIVFFCLSVEVCMSYVCTSWCWVKRRSGSKKLLKDFLTAASSVNLSESGTPNLVLKTQVK